jgi:hypothetical protein
MKQTITHYEAELVNETLAIAGKARTIVDSSKAVIEQILLIDATADEDRAHELEDFLLNDNELLPPDHLFDRLGVLVLDPLTEEVDCE